jgi:DNA-binding transcriptional regulator YdaS (Cro superfamily)
MKSDYLRKLSRIEREALAERCGMKLTSLNNIIYGKKPSIEMACRIESETCGAVSRRDLLPEVNWDLIAGTAVARRFIRNTETRK